jgi:NTP pyrophosphatase (non-canonical NTP hydrolase)
MNLNEYQKAAKSVCLPFAYSLDYLSLGLVAEAGEVAGVYAKYFRDRTSRGVMLEDVKKELGDVLWFVAVLADLHEASLEEIASKNIDKLLKRKENNTIGGSGNDR